MRVRDFDDPYPISQAETSAPLDPDFADWYRDHMAALLTAHGSTSGSSSMSTACYRRSMPTTKDDAEFATPAGRFSAKLVPGDKACDGLPCARSRPLSTDERCKPMATVTPEQMEWLLDGCVRRPAPHEHDLFNPNADDRLAAFDEDTKASDWCADKAAQSTARRRGRRR